MCFVWLAHISLIWANILESGVLYKNLDSWLFLKNPHLATTSRSQMLLTSLDEECTSAAAAVRQGWFQWWVIEKPTNSFFQVRIYDLSNQVQGRVVPGLMQWHKSVVKDCCSPSADVFCLSSWLSSVWQLWSSLSFLPVPPKDSHVTCRHTHVQKRRTGPPIGLFFL